MIMNEFEVWDSTKGPDVSFKAAPVAFPAYETYKQQAMMAADYIRSIDLSEDNVKQVKNWPSAGRSPTSSTGAG